MCCTQYATILDLVYMNLIGICVLMLLVHVFVLLRLHYWVLFPLQSCFTSRTFLLMFPTGLIMQFSILLLCFKCFLTINSQASSESITSDRSPWEISPQDLLRNGQRYSQDVVLLTLGKTTKIISRIAMVIERIKSMEFLPGNVVPSAWHHGTCLNFCYSDACCLLSHCGSIYIFCSQFRFTSSFYTPMDCFICVGNRIVLLLGINHASMGEQDSAKD